VNGKLEKRDRLEFYTVSHMPYRRRLFYKAAKNGFGLSSTAVLSLCEAWNELTCHIKSHFVQYHSGLGPTA
jgi:hypothetical protein